MQIFTVILNVIVFNCSNKDDLLSILVQTADCCYTTLIACLQHSAKRDFQLQLAIYCFQASDWSVATFSISYWIKQLNRTSLPSLNPNRTGFLNVALVWGAF